MPKNFEEKAEDQCQDLNQHPFFFPIIFAYVSSEFEYNHEVRSFNASEIRYTHSLDLNKASVNSPSPFTK